MMNRKRARNDSLDLSRNISVPDSTRRNNLQNGAGNQKVTVSQSELLIFSEHLTTILKLLHDMTRATSSALDQNSNQHVPFPVKVEDMNQTPNNQTVDEDIREEGEENSANEEFNRSDDNVLITNKYNNMAVKTVQNKGAANDEWVCTFLY